MSVPTRFTFDESGVAFETTLSETRLRWTAFQKFLETDSLFILYESDRVFHMVPKRGFQSAEEMTGFLAALVHSISNGVLMPALGERAHVRSPGNDDIRNPNP